jgi:hypothetical protein
MMTHTPPHSLKDSNENPKVKIAEEERIGITFLGSQHFRGKRGMLELRDGD